MSFVIKILSSDDGEPSEFDGKYVKLYDPAFMNPGGYDGGLLEVTDKTEEALAFDTPEDAWNKWREFHYRDGDGDPIRPLTGWNVIFERHEQKGSHEVHSQQR